MTGEFACVEEWVTGMDAGRLLQGVFDQLTPHRKVGLLLPVSLIVMLMTQ